MIYFVKKVDKNNLMMPFKVYDDKPVYEYVELFS